jgi:aryl-alcohol dehydrogenase-like predicted oxidoreductase
VEYRQMGSTGVRVSTVGLGTNQFGGKVDEQDVIEIIAAAIDVGINLIDTADVYQAGRSEQTLGAALEGHWDRVILATKVYGAMGEGPNDRGSSRYHILAGVEASLQRLNTDHIDLYQIHRWDETTPVEETLRALDDLVAAGKVRYIGASNYAAWQLAHSNLLAEIRGWTRFSTIQNHYHMLERAIEHEVLPYCRAHKVGVLPFFPLAGGFLTGKYRRGEAAPEGSRGESSPYVQRYMSDANYTRVERMTDWAEERGHTMGELAHAWLLGHPEVCSVISGATKVSHVQQNAQSAGWLLSAHEMAEIGQLLVEGS